MVYFVEISEEKFKVRMPQDEAGPFAVNGESIRVDWVQLGQRNHFLLIVEDASYELFVEDRGRDYSVTLNGTSFQVGLEEEKDRFIRSLIKTDAKHQRCVEVRAPMPGLLSKILVKEGDKVTKGAPLLIIEAMKMENEIRATVDGVVSKLKAVEGESVEKDTLLLSVE